MLKYYLIALAAVLVTALAQLFLKLGALHGKANNSLLRSYLNLHTIAGYFLMLAVTLLNVYAYRYIDLKIAATLLPLTFIFVGILSFWKLNENFSKNNFLGAAIILIGIFVFGL